MTSALVTVLAVSVREEVADFLSALVTVYLLLIIAYILSQLYLGFGGRVPYSRWSRGILDFLEQTVGPYLAIFRRFIPPLGPIDLSPIIGIFLLQIVGRIVVGLIRG